MSVPMLKAIFFMFGFFSDVRQIFKDNTIIIYNNNNKNDFKS